MLLPTHSSYSHNESTGLIGLDWNLSNASMPFLLRDLAHPPSRTDCHLEYVPSVRTTATTSRHLSLNQLNKPEISNGLEELSLLANIANSGATPLPHPTTMTLEPSQSVSSPLGSLSVPTSSFSTAQIEAILGSASTSHCGDSDSSSSGSENALNADSWPVPLESARLTFAGMARTADSEPGTSQQQPYVTTPPILTNSSVTTKAMSGAIESQNSLPCSAGAALLMPAQSKYAMAGMARTDCSPNPDQAKASDAAAAKALLDSLSSSRNGMENTDGTLDPMWQLLQAGCTTQLE
ncbi:hypothetical protein LPJ55_002566 [Coemansia sp. RSA 990]|nr:hypothetical protein LPJ68_001628 [Coemansia sp. RSA 1086]KAJ1751360.1 hypothetical protein LPJ79_002141 [Coemansia sp. RSA 1821]KAJ1873100.1 hypothetical protein LPJ55_002566 [Coemansia sp. RSA 990]KAJ2669875.1 hypothetical protein IWW42_004329 [Coemansia sp. RSA 1085]